MLAWNNNIQQLKHSIFNVQKMMLGANLRAGLDVMFFTIDRVRLSSYNRIHTQEYQEK